MRECPIKRTIQGLCLLKSVSLITKHFVTALDQIYFRLRTLVHEPKYPFSFFARFVF